MWQHKRTRFFEENKHLIMFEEQTPHEVAKQAIEKYSRIATKRPSWDWPKRSVRFAHEAASFLACSNPNLSAIEEICRQFREDFKYSKGLFDLWALHDLLWDQVEAGEKANARNAS